MDILVYGFGKMASAMVDGWLRAGVDPGSITAYNPRPKPSPAGINFVTSPPDRGFDVVVLGFKPHMLADIAPAMQGAVHGKTIVLSILAGITLDELEASFPRAGARVRFMPNLAVALGKSPNLLAARNLSDLDRETVTRLANHLGSAVWLDDESKYNLATALAGSGPGFVYRFIDALAAAGADLGLDRQLSEQLALEMVEGAAALAANSDFSPAELADRVASPGGMTREGLNVLDNDNALKSLLKQVLRATADRGDALAAGPPKQG